MMRGGREGAAARSRGAGAGVQPGVCGVRTFDSEQGTLPSLWHLQVGTEQFPWLSSAQNLGRARLGGGHHPKGLRVGGGGNS